MSRNSQLFLLILGTLFFGHSSFFAQSSINEYDFVYLDQYLTQAKYDVRYAGNNNFVGQPIDGYTSTRLVMTRQAAMALQQAEKELEKKGFGLKIFDTYRPQRAVEHFRRWARDPADTLMKQPFYPHLPKDQLFKLGYISTRSGHSRGSTIDCTLYHLATGEEVDMGGPYDYFSELSHHGYTEISSAQKSNRELLRITLSNHGFRSYSKEWWHYTLRGEPYPKTYFDFVVTGE